MKGLPIGVHISWGGANANTIVDAIVQADEAGIDTAWMTSGGVAADPLVIFAAATARAKRINFGTCIIPTFPRHPLALVQAAVAIDQLAPGRLTLGVGPSHQVSVEPTFGIAFDKPLQHLREYLTILRSILYDGKVQFEGKRLTARAQLAGPTGVKVMASALRPNGFSLCGELADGAISWVCPLPYLRDVAVPALKAGAAKAGRQAPPLVAHVPVVVSENIDAVREASRKQIGFYPRVPYYSQMFQDAGFPEAKEGQLSDRMIDALVVHGSAAQVTERLRGLPSFGVGQLLAMPITISPETTQATLATLGALAQSD